MEDNCAILYFLILSKKGKRQMRSRLKFYNRIDDELSNCGRVLDIEVSSRDMPWTGVILEQGSSPCFHPNDVYTPYFYFALALDEDLHWQAVKDGELAQITTQPGNIWVNPPNTAFTHNITEPCYFLILAIQEQEFLRYCPLDIEIKELSFLNNYNLIDKTIQGIMELFLLELQGRTDNGPEFKNNLVSLLSAHYIHNYSNYSDLKNNAQLASKFDQEQIELIDGYIDQHISESILIEDLAELLNCSKFHFLREFKKITGSTPYQYLMHKRMHQAEKLLSIRSANISHVALSLGFNDQSHFTRAFKAHFQKTPGQFMKSLATK